MSKGYCRRFPDYEACTSTSSGCSGGGGGGGGAASPETQFGSSTAVETITINDQTRPQNNGHGNENN